jgi:hypothetical protein
MDKFKENNNVLSMFGLTREQLGILFSIEKLLVEKDIESSKKRKAEKLMWLNGWSSSILDYLNNDSSEKEFNFMPLVEIIDKISEQKSKSINNTWYYLTILEATLFEPYTALGKNKDDDKTFSKLKYKDDDKINFIKSMVKNSEIMDEMFVDRFKDTYKKSLNEISGKYLKIGLGVVSVIAIAAIAAATAGAGAGPIAVAIFGSQFTGLSGAALTSACLAMAGGGAIAVGGAGMAGGAMAIVGGGALLGTAVGGAAVGATSLFVSSIPQLTLTQAAKLEVVLKEIVINAQEDIKSAQEVLANYKDQIVKLNGELGKLKLSKEKNKDEIKNMKKSIEYMEKAYKDIMVFLSSYEIGIMHED